MIQQKEFEVVMDVRGFIRRVHSNWSDRNIESCDVVMFPIADTAIIKRKEYVYIHILSDNDRNAKKKATSLFMQFVGKRWRKKERKKYGTRIKKKRSS